MLEFRQIQLDDPLYEQVLMLRHNVLRKPLGMNLFDEDLSDEKNQYTMVLVKKKLIQACLFFKKLGPRKLKLRQMAVLESEQSKGLGKGLVQRSEEWACDRQFTSIELHAREYACGFYERLGYEKVGDVFEEVGLPHFKMTKTILIDQTE